MNKRFTHALSTPFIQTPGVVIRPFEVADAQQFVLAALESVETVGKWLPWCNQDYRLADAEHWFEICNQSLKDGSAFDVGIFTTDGVLLGGIAINQINRQHRIGNIGYWVRQSYQKKGIATFAVRHIAQYGFNTLGLVRLEIVVARDNLASRKVAEKSGGLFEVLARNRLIIFGEPVTAAVYSLTPSCIRSQINLTHRLINSCS